MLQIIIFILYICEFSKNGAEWLRVSGGVNPYKWQLRVASGLIWATESWKIPFWLVHFWSIQLKTLLLKGSQFKIHS